MPLDLGKVVAKILPLHTGAPEVGWLVWRLPHQFEMWCGKGMSSPHQFFRQLKMFDRNVVWQAYVSATPAVLVYDFLFCIDDVMKPSLLDGLQLDNHYTLQKSSLKSTYIPVKRFSSLLAVEQH